jgi:hypothetical protein
MLWNMRLWIFVLLGAALLVAVVLLPPLAEPRMFRSLADQRAFLGIPNFLDVVSNVPFLLVGVWGLYFLTRDARQPRAFTDPAERWPYAVCFLSVALIAPGSAYYHLAPDDARLMWDRLPISMGFMALVSAVIVERISRKAGLRLLLPLMLAGAASVLYWRWSLLRGAEDILPYAAVQYGAMAAVLLALLLFPARYARGADLLVALAIYALAKLAEVLDRPIYALGGIVSGHTLKHLLAALAVGWLVRMLYLRRPKNRDVPHF